MSFCFQTSCDCSSSFSEIPVYRQWAGLAAWFEFLCLQWQKRPQLVSKALSKDVSWRTGTAGPSGSSAVCWVVWSPGQFCLQYVNYLHIQFYKLFQRRISVMLLSKLPSYPLQDEANLHVLRAFFSLSFCFSFSPFFLSTDCPNFMKASKKRLINLLIFFA